MASEGSDDQVPAAAARASLASANRIVIKIGTATIMKKGEAGGTARPGSAGGVDVEYLHHMAAEVAALTRIGGRLLTLGDPGYPQLLRRVAVPLLLGRWASAGRLPQRGGKWGLPKSFPEPTKQRSGLLECPPAMPLHITHEFTPTIGCDLVFQ